MIKVRKTRHGTCSACGVGAGKEDTLKQLSFSTDGIGWTSISLCNDCMNSLYLELMKIRRWSIENSSKQ